MANSEEAILSNQKTIIENQEALLKNQSTIIHNQEALLKNQTDITGNQESLLKNQSDITGNQEVIVHNQASIIDNQKHIVDNQVVLNAISKTQAYILNLVRKISGQPESQEETEQFLNKLKTEAPESVKSNALEEPETL